MPEGTERHIQSGEPRLEAVFEKHALFALGPVDVLGQDVDLDLLAVWNGVEAVEQCADWEARGRELSMGYSTGEGGHVLILAVFALAVVETKERDRVMTSATPFALLARTT